ncbi:hypothetical protein FIBSPDRAFT_1042879 [Athelia psychrophila]|uniref:Uncharacterized protein n=1 Tax=Athelia psychrophila TaxID=1759441 RepID=A0A166LXE8_9AGAM|nr:hypothetical protein FIBSPDRAFT_1042879 [Fibularhizoctonia sp. CBS 109695]
MMINSETAAVPRYEDLFDPQTYAGLDVQSGRKLLSCVEEQEADIRNNSCVFTPEVTQGPYHPSEAHPIWQNIPELQFSLFTLLGIGVINVEPCLPLLHALVNTWHANATGDGGDKEGVGGGVIEGGVIEGGVADECVRRRAVLLFVHVHCRIYTPRRMLIANPLAPAIFPGYYTGCTLHIHTKVFTDRMPQPNGTFRAGRLALTGQFFFDDDVSETINKVDLRFCPLLYSFFGAEPHHDWGQCECCV